MKGQDIVQALYFFKRPSLILLLFLRDLRVFVVHFDVLSR